MQATRKVSNDMEAALARLQQYSAWLQRDPGNASLYRQCADAARELQRYDLMLEIVDAALARDPGNAALRFDRATAQIGLRDFRSALATLADVPTASEEQQQALDANRALCHFMLGEHAQALPHLVSDYERGHRTPQSLFMLVRAHHFLGQLSEAVAIANANAEAAAQDARLAGAYALLFLDAEDAGAASRWAATALRLDPRSIDGNVTDGTLSIMRLQTDRAERLFKTALEAGPETARAWIGLGTLAMLQKDLPQAETHFERGLKTLPGYVGGWHMLGWSQLLRKDLQAAEQSFNRALALDRNFSETHGGLAAIDALNGKVESARQRLEIATRLDPQCMSAQFAAAVLADPTLRGAGAQEILQQALLGLGAQHHSALGKLLLKHSTSPSGSGR